MTASAENTGRATSAALIVLLASVAMAGCRDCGGPATGPYNASPQEVQARGKCRPLELPDGGPPEGREVGSALFVITDLRFGEVDDGLDMDCVETPGGCIDDLCREGPSDGRGGVDNRLGPLALRLSGMAGSDLQREMTRAIESGRHPLLIRVINATSFEGGRADAVELSFGRDVDDDVELLYSGNGRVRPDPEGPSDRPSRFSPSAIEGGVVVAGPTSDWMPLFWTRGEIAAVPVEAAYLRFRIHPSGGEGGVGRLTEGLLAGAITPSALSEAVMAMDGRTAKVLQRLGPIVRALVRQQADLDRVPAGPTERRCERSLDCPSGQSCRRDRCDEPPERFDALSFGVRFEAVAVREEAATSSAP